MLQDIRFALRMLAGTLGVTGLATVALALGIGALGTYGSAVGSVTFQ